MSFLLPFFYTEVSGEVATCASAVKMGCSALILISAVTYMETIWKISCCDDTTRPNGVIEAHPLLVVRISSLPQEILMVDVVGMLTDHPAASFYLDRVAALEMGRQVASQEQPGKSLSSKKVICNKTKVTPVTLENI